MCIVYTYVWVRACKYGIVVHSYISTVPLEYGYARIRGKR